MAAAHIIRGLPGSGKTGLVHRLELEAVVCSADDFFLDSEGEYQFDPRLLGHAHAQCMGIFLNTIAKGWTAIVDNTNSQKWEMENYVFAAQLASMPVVIHEIMTPGIEAVRDFAARNTHGVPAAAILNMWYRWEEWPEGQGVTIKEYAPILTSERA